MFLIILFLLSRETFTVTISSTSCGDPRTSLFSTRRLCVGRQPAGKFNGVYAVGEIEKEELPALLDFCQKRWLLACLLYSLLVINSLHYQSGLFCDGNSYRSGGGCFDWRRCFHPSPENIILARPNLEMRNLHIINVILPRNQIGSGRRMRQNDSLLHSKLEWGNFLLH